MELLHNLWHAVSTEDENLTKYVLIFLGFIEIYVTLKLSAAILNISYTKKQQNTYIIIMGILFSISTLLIPKQISIFIHLFLTPFVVKFVFKTSIIKSILADIIPMLISVIFESIYAQFCIMLLGKTFLELQYILIYRVPIMLIIYFNIFLLSLLVNMIKKHITFFEKIDAYRKKL